MSVQVLSFDMDQLKVFRTDTLKVTEPSGYELKFWHQAPEAQTSSLIFRSLQFTFKY